MKALVLWAEPRSTNLGVRALAEGTSELLAQAYGDVDVAFQGFGAGDAPVRIGSLRPQVRRLLSRSNELIDWVRGFDVVVDTRAGDSFADIYGLRRLTVMTAMEEIVHRAGVPLVFGPQTIGPFDTVRGRLIGRRSLRRAAVVMARDAISAEQSAAVGRVVDVLTTDVVFAIGKVVSDKTRDVIVNPSGLLWTENQHVDAARYRALLVQLCRELQDRGRRVHLLSHVLDSPLRDNDVPVARELAGQLAGDVEVLVPSDLSDARRLLASSQVVIGSRMHACLNALSVGVPAIPLSYSRKFEPLLRHLGWNGTVELRDAGDLVPRVMTMLDQPDLTERAGAVRDRADGLLEVARESLRQVVSGDGRTGGGRTRGRSIRHG